MTTGSSHPLDDVAGLALRGAHAPYAVASGSAIRYHLDVAPFGALGPDPGPGGWADLAGLPGARGGIALLAPPDLPGGWTAVATYRALQMVGSVETSPPVDDGAELVALRTDQDRADAGDLARRTEPGPFGPRTTQLGAFVGVRDGGRLVAMAGERMRPPGWTEVSAVCTDPAARGRGLAARLVTAVADGIRARGERPFLHVLRTNTGAIRVYERVGFTTRREVDIVVVRHTP